MRKSERKLRLREKDRKAAELLKRLPPEEVARRLGYQDVGKMLRWVQKRRTRDKRSGRKQQDMNIRKKQQRRKKNRNGT